jgi:hypothetical protein
MIIVRLYFQNGRLPLNGYLNVHLVVAPVVDEFCCEKTTFV